MKNYQTLIISILSLVLSLVLPSSSAFSETTDITETQQSGRLPGAKILAPSCSVYSDDPDSPLEIDGRYPGRPCNEQGITRENYKIYISFDPKYPGPHTTVQLNTKDSYELTEEDKMLDTYYYASGTTLPDDVTHEQFKFKQTIDGPVATYEGRIVYGANDGLRMTYPVNSPVGVEPTILYTQDCPANGALANEPVRYGSAGQVLYVPCDNAEESSCKCDSCACTKIEPCPGQPITAGGPILDASCQELPLQKQPLRPVLKAGGETEEKSISLFNAIFNYHEDNAALNNASADLIEKIDSLEEVRHWISEGQETKIHEATKITFYMEYESGKACVYARGPDPTIKWRVEFKAPNNLDEATDSFIKNDKRVYFKSSTDKHCLSVPESVLQAKETFWGDLISPTCTNYNTVDSRWVTPFTSVVIQCVEETMTNIFLPDPGATYQDAEGNIVESGTFFSNTQDKLKTAIRILLAMYIIFFGYKLIFAKSALQRGDWIWFGVKFALVVYFAIGPGMTKLLPVFVETSKTLSLLFVEAGMGTKDATLAALQEALADAQNDYRTAQNQYNEERIRQRLFIERIRNAKENLAKIQQEHDEAEAEKNAALARWEAVKNADITPLQLAYDALDAIRQERLEAYNNLINQQRAYQLALEERDRLKALYFDIDLPTYTTKRNTRDSTQGTFEQAEAAFTAAETEREEFIAARNAYDNTWNQAKQTAKVNYVGSDGKADGIGGAEGAYKVAVNKHETEDAPAKLAIYKSKYDAWKNARDTVQAAYDIASDAYDQAAQDNATLIAQYEQEHEAKLAEAKAAYTQWYNTKYAELNTLWQTAKEDNKKWQDEEDRIADLISEAQTAVTVATNTVTSLNAEYQQQVSDHQQENTEMRDIYQAIKNDPKPGLWTSSYSSSWGNFAGSLPTINFRGSYPNVPNHKIDVKALSYNLHHIDTSGWGNDQEYEIRIKTSYNHANLYRWNLYGKRHRTNGGGQCTILGNVGDWNQNANGSRGDVNGISTTTDIPRGEMEMHLDPMITTIGGNIKVDVHLTPNGWSIQKQIDKYTTAIETNPEKPPELIQAETDLANAQAALATAQATQNPFPQVTLDDVAEALANRDELISPNIDIRSDEAYNRAINGPRNTAEYKEWHRLANFDRQEWYPCASYPAAPYCKWQAALSSPPDAAEQDAIKADLDLLNQYGGKFINTNNALLNHGNRSSTSLTNAEITEINSLKTAENKLQTVLVMNDEYHEWQDLLDNPPSDFAKRSTQFIYQKVNAQAYNVGNNNAYFADYKTGWDQLRAELQQLLDAKNQEQSETIPNDQFVALRDAYIEAKTAYEQAQSALSGHYNQGNQTTGISPTENVWKAAEAQLNSMPNPSATDIDNAARHLCLAGGICHSSDYIPGVNAGEKNANSRLNIAWLELQEAIAGGIYYKSKYDAANAKFESLATQLADAQALANTEEGYEREGEQALAALKAELEALEMTRNLAQTALLNYIYSAQGQPGTGDGSFNEGYPYCDFRYAVYEKESTRLWDTLDCKLARYLGVGDAPNDSMAPRSMQIASRAIFSTTLGLPIFCMSLIFLTFLIMIMVRAVHIYIMAFIALMLLIYISPLIIPAALFKFTKGIFDSWLKQVVAMILQPVILFAFLSFMLAIMDYVAFGDNKAFVSTDYSGGIATHIVNKNGGTKPATKMSECADPHSMICIFQTTKNSSTWAFNDDAKIFRVKQVELGDDGDWYLFIGLLQLIAVCFVVHALLSSVESLSSQITGAMGTEGGIATISSAPVSSPVEMAQTMSQTTGKVADSAIKVGKSVPYAPGKIKRTAVKTARTASQVAKGTVKAGKVTGQAVKDASVGVSKSAATALKGVKQKLSNIKKHK